MVKNHSIADARPSQQKVRFLEIIKKKIGILVWPRFNTGEYIKMQATAVFLLTNALYKNFISWTDKNGASVFSLEERPV